MNTATSTLILSVSYDPLRLACAEVPELAIV